MTGMEPEVFDRAIVEARAGDPDGLAALWRAWNPGVLRYARARGALDADDTASQVWLDAARGLGRFEGERDDFSRWLFTIARRRIVDERRRRGRRPEIPMEQLPETTAADSRFAQSDGLATAIALVRRLPDDQADAVLLRIVADLDVTEVADIMGRSESNVRVLTHRGLRKLGDLLGATSASATRKPVTHSPAPAISPER